MLGFRNISAPKHLTTTQNVIGRRFSSPSSSIFDPSSFWSELRQKAANAITSSLSDKERDTLMTKYAKPIVEEPTTNKTDNNPTAATNGTADNTSESLSKTISEAVAEARMKEARDQSDKWQKEMEQLKHAMQKASEARIETEVARERQRLQFEQWQLDLEKEKAAKTLVEIVDDESSVAEAPADAVLGPVIMDFGNKRLHVVSAEALSNLPVWKKQRTYRHDRAKTMAKDKMKSLHLGMPGVIGLYQDKSGNLSILDGQHRVGMMTILAEKKANIDLSKVMVEVYSDPERTSEEGAYATDLFVEINKAEPVKLVDMPGVAKKSEKEILDKAAEKLRDQYPDMFSSSQKCRSPHLNIDNLRDSLFAVGVLQKHSIKSQAALVKWLLEKNAALEAKLGEGKVKGVPPRALQKAQKFGFYLGLESTWIYE